MYLYNTRYMRQNASQLTRFLSLQQANEILERRNHLLNNTMRWLEKWSNLPVDGGGDVGMYSCDPVKKKKKKTNEWMNEW